MKYEMMLILKPMLPEDIRSNVQNSFEKLVKKFSGEVKDTDVWGKKHLAYEIDGHEEGYYLVYQLEMPAEQIEEFQREMKFQTDIIRFLLTKID